MPSIQGETQFATNVKVPIQGERHILQQMRKYRFKVRDTFCNKCGTTDSRWETHFATNAELPTQGERHFATNAKLPIQGETHFATNAELPIQGERHILQQMRNYRFKVRDVCDQADRVMRSIAQYIYS